MLGQKNMKKILIACGIVLSIFSSSNALAKAQICPESDHVKYNSDELQIITSINPELLEPAANGLNINHNTKKSSNWYSWLTESHNMPSLHFIQFLELFHKS